MADEPSSVRRLADVDETCQRVIAVFDPKRVDDLRPGAMALVGKVVEWNSLWVVEGGPYEGQWCFLPTDYRSEFPGWVPACDLREPDSVHHPSAPAGEG